MSKNRRHNRWGTHSGSVTAKHGRAGPGKREATLQERRVTSLRELDSVIHRLYALRRDALGKLSRIEDEIDRAEMLEEVHANPGLAEFLAMKSTDAAGEGEG